MQSLELKIPPPLIVAVAAGLHALSLWVWPVAWISMPTWLIVACLFVASLYGLGGLWGCLQCKTTVHPWSPEDTRVLVTHGVFAWSRNPMYVALLGVLLPWLCSPVHPLSPIWFLAAYLWLNQFQVMPEERILADKFGDSFLAYQARVRRWL